MLQAISLGMQKIGISDHSYTFFDENYCMKKDEINNYIETISLLKEKYSGRIQVLCGIEQDYYSDMPTDAFDYIIGSVHYLKYGDDYPPIDSSRRAPDGSNCVQAAANRFENGDVYAIAEKYFSTVSDVARKTNCDIIGHFDLISKFNEDGSLFDESLHCFRDAAVSAADELLKCGKPFEINTGAISRGLRTTPYPSAFLMKYIREHGGKFILSSDAHCTENICFGFDKYNIK